MPTATQIAERALKHLGLVQSGNSASSTDVSDATTALSAMIASWNLNGLSGLPSTAATYADRYEQALVALLAVRLSEEYGATVGPVLAKDAQDGMAQIEAAHFVVPESVFDSALSNTGPFWADGLIISEPENYGAWEALTDYEPRQYVINNENLYECVTGGTSAASGGPTGEAASITDGTVVWIWRRVTAE